jgi:hypothetical protein
MNESRVRTPVFNARLSIEDQDYRTFYESLGLKPQVINGELCLSKADTLRLCSIVNTKKAAELENYIRRSFP